MLTVGGFFFHGVELMRPLIRDSDGFWLGADGVVLKTDLAFVVTSFDRAPDGVQQETLAQPPILMILFVFHNRSAILIAVFLSCGMS